MLTYCSSDLANSSFCGLAAQGFLLHSYPVQLFNAILSSSDHNLYVILLFQSLLRISENRGDSGV
ncbi:hypothetical protein E2C01_046854 [Portunus trituberculatus]|uniref:Uncharacterized protein n=1 Tax=Portunus trituberculatus TaxID=210409 RepID=A0A5B7G218_PORTR|nr:hypothetical protein [Portunus trituberculatus]